MKIYWDTFLKKFQREPKHQFPVGSVVFKGFQGEGKTLSMVQYAFAIKREYPNCVIFSNIRLFGIEYNYMTEDIDFQKAFVYSNGLDGVLILIDEAHLFFNKKTGISFDVLSCISQQRKDRRRLVFSSQIWDELDISLRKQVDYVVSCSNFLGILQINKWSKGRTLKYDKLQNEYVAQKDHFEIFKRNIELYNRYDTFQKIIKNTDYQRELASLPVQFQIDKDVIKRYKN